MRKQKEFTKGEPLLPGDNSRRRGGPKSGSSRYQGEGIPPSFESWSFTKHQLKNFEMVLRALKMDAERRQLQLKASLEQTERNIERLQAIHLHDIDIVVEPDDDGFHAYCPALKGLHTGGTTIEEATANAKDAVIAYLQSIIEHSDPIPENICKAP